MKRIMVIFLSMLAASSLLAEDWTRWLGPDGRNISYEKWDVGEGRFQKPVWEKQLGNGFSAACVEGDLVYSMGNKDGKDFLYCFQAKDGKEVWTYSYPCHEGSQYKGPQSSPVIQGNYIYIVSRVAEVHCVDKKTGKKIWSTDVAKVANAKSPKWEHATSALVQDGKVYVNVGDNGACLDAKTGKVVWMSSGTAGYATPVPVKWQGKDVLAIFGRESLLCVSPASGKVLWSHEWITKYDVNAADPAPVGDKHIFITSNYRKGGALVDISGQPKQAWFTDDMRCHFGTPVVYEGYAYGNSEGTLTCLDLKTGKAVWTNDGYGRGGMTMADGKLIILGERGTLEVVEASPKKYNLLARAQRIMDSRSYVMPVLANGKIYIRNNDGHFIALDLPY